MIFISIINLITCSFFYVYLYYKNKNITETELIKEYNINFNKEKYYLGLNETIDIIIDNKNYTKIDLYIEDETAFLNLDDDTEVLPENEYINDDTELLDDDTELL